MNTKVKTFVAYEPSLESAARKLDEQMNEFLARPEVSISRMSHDCHVSTESTMSGYLMVRQLMYQEIEKQ